jgi:fructose-1,6-bisphosphatase/inositol monophosphatase family enzyme
MPRKYTSEDLCELGVGAIKGVVRQLRDHYIERTNSSLIRLADLESGKPMIAADKDAERFFERYLDTHDHGHFKDIEFYGEETLGNRPIDLTGQEGTCVLVDALDGSDLYERNLGNWCSAATFFTPTNSPGQRIRAAIVGLPDGSTYFATDDSDSVSVYRRPKGREEKVRGMSRVQDIENASICFYGQKVGNFVCSSKVPMWSRLLAREKTKTALRGKSRKKSIRFRLYNLAGIPMIVKMIDKVAENGAGIDAVVDFMGQKAHDIVPGAFFARKVGAEVTDLAGNRITINRLEELLLRPNTESLRYIIASSKKLRDKIVQLAKP